MGQQLPSAGGSFGSRHTVNFVGNKTTGQSGSTTAGGGGFGACRSYVRLEHAMFYQNYSDGSTNNATKDCTGAAFNFYNCDCANLSGKQIHVSDVECYQNQSYGKGGAIFMGFDGDVYTNNLIVQDNACGISYKHQASSGSSQSNRG